MTHNSKLFSQVSTTVLVDRAKCIMRRTPLCALVGVEGQDILEAANVVSLFENTLAFGVDLYGKLMVHILQRIGNTNTFQECLGFSLKRCGGLSSNSTG